MTYLKHKVIGISSISNETCSLLRTYANLVILISQILHPLKIEGFDDTFIAKMVLRTSSGSLNHRSFFATDLRQPQSKFVWFVRMHRCHRKIHMFKGPNIVQVDVKMLVRIDATKPLKSQRPNGTCDQQVLFVANPISWRQ